MKKKNKPAPVVEVKASTLPKALLIAIVGFIVHSPFIFILVFFPFSHYFSGILHGFPNRIYYSILFFASFCFLFTFVYCFLWGLYAERLLQLWEDGKIAAAYIGFLLNSIIMLCSVIFSLILKTYYSFYFNDEGGIGGLFVHFYLYGTGLFLSYMTSSVILLVVTRKLLRI